MQRKMRNSEKKEKRHSFIINSVKNGKQMKASDLAKTTSNNQKMAFMTVE